MIAWAWDAAESSFRLCVLVLVLEVYSILFYSNYRKIPLIEFKEYYLLHIQTR